MTLKLNGSSSGSVSIDAPASTTSGADITFALPVADGSSGQVLQTNASGQLSFISKPTPTYGTKTAIGTSTTKDITGITSSVKKVYLFIDNWSFGSGDELRIQLGDEDGFHTSGYEGRGGYVSDASYAGSNNITSGFQSYGMGSASYSWSGIFKFYLYDAHTWFLTSQSWTPDGATNYWISGRVTLDKVLTQIRLTNSGSSSFDEGHYKLVTFDNL